MGEQLICRARVMHPGRTLTVAAADVFTLASDAEKPVATALATVAPATSRACRRSPAAAMPVPRISVPPAGNSPGRPYGNHVGAVRMAAYARTEAAKPITKASAVSS
jgi:hypothetical protein